MKVVAQQYILYNGRAYNKGDVIYNPEPEMVELWLESGAVVEPDSAKTTSEPELAPESGQQEPPEDQKPETTSEPELAPAKAERKTALGRTGKKAGGTGAEGDMIGRVNEK